MTLKGDYSDLTNYSVGDVVRFGDDSLCYVLRHPCKAGVPPTVTLYWEWIGQQLQDTVDLILDAIDIAGGGALSRIVANNLTTSTAGSVLDARQGKAIKGLIDGLNPDAKTLVLASSTASSTKKFAITVDDDGELTGTEIVDEGSGT